MDDRNAIARLKAGDIRALETLVPRYQSRALKIAFLIARDRALAEDVVQAAFIRVYERAAQFDDKRPFGPWFHRIVSNDALKAVSRRSRETSLDQDSIAGEPTLADLVPDPRPGPQDRAEQAEVQKAVREALEQLSPAQRAAVVDRYYLGFSEAKTAERGGHTRGTVKQLLHRARAKLRTLLATVEPDGVPAKEARDE